MTKQLNYRLEDGFVWTIFLLAVVLIAGTVAGNREWGFAPTISVITIIVVLPEILRQIGSWFRGARDEKS